MLIDLPIISIADIHRWEPGISLEDHPAYRRVGPDWRGTALDILLAEDVSPNEKLWLVLREECLDARTLRLFACWNAEQMLPKWESFAPEDRRPHKTVAVARRYALGKATDKELMAARRTAWGAAIGTVWRADWSVERRAAWNAAENAAWCAAMSADHSPAWGAAWGGAHSAAMGITSFAKVAHLITMLDTGQ